MKNEFDVFLVRILFFIRMIAASVNEASWVLTPCMLASLMSAYLVLVIAALVFKASESVVLMVLLSRGNDDIGC